MAEHPDPELHWGSCGWDQDSEPGGLAEWLRTCHARRDEVPGTRARWPDGLGATVEQERVGSTFGEPSLSALPMCATRF